MREKVATAITHAFEKQCERVFDEGQAEILAEAALAVFAQSPMRAAVLDTLRRLEAEEVRQIAKQRGDSNYFAIRATAFKQAFEAVSAALASIPESSAGERKEPRAAIDTLREGRE